MKKNSYLIIVAAGLVIGNLIGAGILALPVSLGLCGMVPSALLMIVYGSMMLYTAEVLAREAAARRSIIFDLPSLYSSYLGKTAGGAAVITNGIILYGLLIAYLSGASQIIRESFGLRLPPAAVILIVAVILSGLTMMDQRIINRYNSFLAVLLLTAFLGLLAITLPQLKEDNLHASYWKYYGVAIPLIITASHFHNIIPVLCKNLNWDLKLLRKAILLGMAVAFLMNLTWTLCGIGVLPRHGDNSIILAYVKSMPATLPLSNILNNHLFTVLAVIFSLTAITTSFIANGLGLMSFLRDLICNTLYHPNRQTAYEQTAVSASPGLVNTVKILTFLPPAVIAMLWPQVFIAALDIVGGIGIVTLFGILPCLIALKHPEYKKWFRAAGFIYLLLSCFALLTVCTSLLKIRTFVPDPLEECDSTHPEKQYVLHHMEYYSPAPADDSRFHLKNQLPKGKRP